jgi:queuine tRNA-ribosyltransferase
VNEPVSWSETGADRAARAGVLSTPHGEVRTPAFMPVGTRATVRALDSADLRAVGAEMVLSNTYHLMLRPGAELIERLGGLHGFMAWDGPILTDSGGYQIFSLDPKIDEDGARFRSTYDGSRHTLSPEEAVRIQELLGPDIAMVLDVCIGLPAERQAVQAAMDRTHRWAERARIAHTRPDQALFGIVQGGTDPDLRAESAAVIADLEFPGFGIGGLSVGEPAAERNLALEATVPHLPPDKVRYVMGLGDPEGVLDAVARGADLFDCVWPTRLARHGRAITWSGDFNLKRKEFADDPRPVDDRCECSTCAMYSRAYLRHLLNTGELALHRLLSIHNLTVTLGVLAGARSAIEAGSFTDYQRQVTERRRTGA